MTDQFDRAQALELEDWERRQALAISTPGTAPSALYCQAEDCGEPIPQARREASPGCRFCAECQTRIERVRERNRRP